jgi:hypothetical protein
MTITARIGQFFFFLGFLALIIFFATNQVDMPNYLALCTGTLMLIFGVYLMWTYRNPPRPSDRFSTWRKMGENRTKKRESLEEVKYSQGENRSDKKE